MNTITNATTIDPISDAHLALLLDIARETLGIETFSMSGKLTADFHVVAADDVARALEAAYDAGLVVGYSVRRDTSRDEHGSEVSC